MKGNKNILPVIMAGLGMISAQAQGSSFDNLVQSETAFPMQKIESTGPAIAGVQVKIQGKIYLLLLDATDAHLFPKTLIENTGNIESKVRGVVQKMVSNGKVPVGADVSIESYGTTTPVDIGQGIVGFLTASHVIQSEKSPNDICITNRVIGDSIPKTGFPILNISSTKINKQMSYTQFPWYSQGNFTMIQIRSILHYEGMRQWISARFEKFVGGASGAPVIIENPAKKGDYGIVSIFPGGVSYIDLSKNVAQMPRTEVLNDIKGLAREAAKKGGYYSICR